MGSAMFQDGRLADAQKSRFQAVKRSNMGRDVQHLCRFADAQEYRIPAENRSKMRSAVPPVFDFLMLRNILFRLRILQMCAVPS